MPLLAAYKWVFDIKEESVSNKRGRESGSRIRQMVAS
jgi:hypothetical protein